MTLGVIAHNGSTKYIMSAKAKPRLTQALDKLIKAYMCVSPFINATST